MITSAVKVGDIGKSNSQIYKTENKMFNSIIYALGNQFKFTPIKI